MKQYLFICTSQILFLVFSKHSESHVNLFRRYDLFPSKYLRIVQGVSFRIVYTVGKANADLTKNVFLLKNPQFLPNYY